MTKATWQAAIWAMLVSIQGTAFSQIYINEIFIDPPGSETPREYLEIRGPAGMSLNNYWFLVAENEDTPDQSGDAGLLDLAIDLSPYSIGQSGFLVMRREASNPYTIATDTTIVELPTTLFENSGGTYMLINRGSGPEPIAEMTRLDGLVDNDDDPMTNHDGIDYPGMGQPGWTIEDAIGVFSEGTTGVQAGEAIYGRTYADTNFGPEFPGHEYSWLDASMGQFVSVTFEPNITPEQTYVGVGYEIELIARYGNSTGSGEKDWHATNVTDNSAAGASIGNFAQSGSDPHGFPRPNYDPEGTFPTLESESSQYVPYGTIITDTLGAANYPLNQTSLPWDFNDNGEVDAADYLTWRMTLGQNDPSPGTDPLPANADRDSSVDQTDYDAWIYHFGETLPGGGSTSAPVPEPASWLLAAFAVFAVTAVGRNCR